MFQEALETEGSADDHLITESIRRAASFAIEKPFRYLRNVFLKVQTRNQFAPHYQRLIPVLRRFAPLVNKKRIIVFCVDEARFDDFPIGEDKIISNLEFVDLKLEAEDFYFIDGHPNSIGHAKVGKMLARHLLEPEFGKTEVSPENGEG